MVTPTRKCPACSAVLAIGATICAYCGSQTVQVALSFQQREEVNRLAKRLNALLMAEELRLRRMLETLFLSIWGIGTLLVLLFWLLDERFPNGWVTLLALPVTVLLMRKFLVESYLQRRLPHFFLQEIDPQIRQFSLDRNIPRWQFDQMADFILREDAPLHRFLMGKKR